MLMETKNSKEVEAIMTDEPDIFDKLRKYVSKKLSRSYILRAIVGVQVCLTFWDSISDLAIATIYCNDPYK